ncbi:MAG: hypothetical protein WA989_05900 [Henriciella sp.]|uniref:hypothetical protein n=1 Tax=Henriciella sp. TaxID=1968823 RepID=UPI003C767508
MTKKGETDIKFDVRIPFHHKDFPFVLMWSEKAGCTSLAKWFFWHLGLLDEALDYHPWIHNYENEKFKSRSGYVQDCIKAIESGKPVIKFVRNPYRRAFSGYLELCSPKISQGPAHWTKQWRRQVIGYLTGYTAELEYGFSFRQYVEWLTAQPKFFLDLHLRQQFQPVEQNLDLRYCKIDDDANVLRALETEFGLKSSEGQDALFASEHHHKKISIAPRPATFFFDVAIPVRRIRHFHIIEPTLEEVRRDMVGMKLARYFSDDFITYGYEI